MILQGHSMVRLGKSQAILGGSTNSVYEEDYIRKTIYLLTCSNRYCIISSFARELPIAISHFLAIPIPDTLSGCVTEGNHKFKIVFINIH